MALAEALGIQELRAESLITLGTATWNEGNPAGLADVEKGLRIALEINALSAALRGYNNLASACGDTGEFRRRRELLMEAVRLGMRLGARDGVRFV